MKLRTLIIIVAVILVIAGVFFYFLSRQGNNSSATPGQTGSLPGVTTQQIPGGNSQGGNGTSTAAVTGTSLAFGIVSTDPVLAYFVDSQNNTTLIEPSGVIEMVINGKTSILGSTTTPSIASAAFSFDGKKVFVSSGNTANSQTSVFDIATRSWLSLPQGMQSPVWSPSGYQIAYLTGVNSGTETILLATLSATSTKTASLQTLPMEDSALQWPNKNIIVIADKPSAFTVGSALSFDISAKTIAPLVAELPGMTSIWSSAPKATGLVFSGNSGFQGGNLALINNAGGQKALNFITLPSKCAFNEDVATSTQQISATPSSTKVRSSSVTSATSTASITLVTSTTTLSLYCAVPRDHDTLSVARLPDEYDQKMLFTADDFYKINTASGTVSTVFSDQTQSLDATNVRIFNNTLFFVNRYDQKLYAIKMQ